MSTATNDRDYTLADGQRLHCWHDPEEALDWVCLMADGVCIGCESSEDGLLMACVENVIDGIMRVEWSDERGSFIFSITDEGRRVVDRMAEEGESS